MTRPRIVLTGAGGQLGRELQRALAALGEVAAYDAVTLNITEPDRVCQTLRASRPDVVVNAAAYTAVDQAEGDADRAYALNARAVAVLAEETHALDALLVHYSTDYVFDGSGSAPWREDDACHPLNVYGASKRAGELAVFASGCRHLVFRTSWLYAAHGDNIYRRLRRQMQAGHALRVVNDQIGAPTACRDVAAATAQVLRQVLAPAAMEAGSRWGLYHMSNAGEASWYDFAAEIQAQAGTQSDLQPLLSRDYPSVAQRPLNSRLNNAKLREQFGVHLRDWRAALKLCVQNDTTEWNKA